MDLKTYLKERGESQTDFAARVGTTVPTVSRLAAGTLRPALDLAHRIERATDGSVPTETWLAEQPAESPGAEARAA